MDTFKFAGVLEGCIHEWFTGGHQRAPPSRRMHTMSTETYTTIKLPLAFVSEFIDPLVGDRGQGYSSRSEVVRDAVRDLADKLRRRDATA